MVEVNIKEDCEEVFERKLTVSKSSSYINIPRKFKDNEIVVLIIKKKRRK